MGENILNKIIEIEDNQGNTIMVINIDEKGNIIKMNNGEIADIDNDYYFETNKLLIRLQQID